MAEKNSDRPKAQEKIISEYMNFVLENGNEPVSVYAFCKETKRKEEDFYTHFGSFKSLKSAIWEMFHTKTIALLEQNEDYRKFGSKDKMLSYFYTFFEMLTANRSYVLAANQRMGMTEKAAEFSGLRKQIRSFAGDLIEADNAQKDSRWARNNKTVFSEGAWWHFMFILKFWLDDNSSGFEKTDLAIEKSVNTIFDLFDNTPLDNIIDFGKFLVKERLS